MAPDASILLDKNLDKNLNENLNKNLILLLLVPRQFLTRYTYKIRN